MKHALLFFLFMLCCTLAVAQSEGQVKIVCTDGTTIIGVLQSADGTAVTIKIAGVEMTIPMSEVRSMEEYSATTTQQNAGETSVTAKELLSSNYDDYIITDNNPEYPDYFFIQLGNQKLTMILVRGGSFNMGYDYWKSTKMDSEPVHRVDLSSYYVSKEFIDDQVVFDYLSLDDSEMKARKDSLCCCSWSKAKHIVDSIATKQGVPYRLLTEAEWEYAAKQPVSMYVFTPSGYNYYEWCYDLYGKYPQWRQDNPTGPPTNKDGNHVVRKYKDPSLSKWARFSKDDTDRNLVRLAISADKIPNINSDSE